MSTVVSAPGSIVLPDRKALENGLPGLLLACSQRVYVSITKAVRLNVQPDCYTTVVSHVLNKLFGRFKDEKHNWTVTVSSSFIDEKEFGFFPAVTVALIGAVMYATKRLWNPLEIHKIAYEILKSESKFADAESTITTFGGVIWYRKELSYLTSLWQLPIRIKPELQQFFLIKAERVEERQFRGSDKETEEWIRQFAEVLKRGDSDELFQVIKRIGEISIFSGEKIQWLLGFGKQDKSTTMKPIRLSEEGIRLEKSHAL